MTIITTSRFMLRLVADADAPTFARLCNDALVARNTSRIPHPYTLDDAHAFTRYAIEAAARGDDYPFAVVNGGEIIACAGATNKSAGLFELGYWVGADHRGAGVASEAARAVAAFAFARLGAESLAAGHFTDNPASGRVLAKLGFTPTGEIVRQFSRGRGGEDDCARLALARRDFIAPEGVSFS